MTPTELANALRDVEIANEEENYAKFQSDCAIRDDAAKALENMTIECKDLEWDGKRRAEGCRYGYSIAGTSHFRWMVRYYNGMFSGELASPFASFSSAHAAANEHNKQQFQAIIEQWRKS